MPPVEQKRHISSRWRDLAILLGLAAIVAAPLWHLRTINRNMPSSHADLVPVWVGVKTALARQDPYSEATTRRIQMVYYGRPVDASDQVNKMGMIYPLHIAIILAPIALLSWEQLRLAFLLVVPVAMATSVPLWLRTLNLSTTRYQTFITATFVLGSWPMMWGLRQLQPTLLVMIFLAAGCWMLRCRRDVSAGVLLAFATIKPQLAGGLLLWLILWSIHQRRWRFIASLTATTALLLIGSIWMEPGWIPRWLGALDDYRHYLPSAPALQILFGRWIGSLLTLAIAASAAAMLWKLRTCDMESPEFGIAIGACLSATVVVLPTFPAMIYNQILVLPALLVVISTRPANTYADLARRFALMSLGWGFVATILAAVLETLAQPSELLDHLPFLNYLLPTLALIALLMIAGHRKASKPKTADLGTLPMAAAS